MTANPGLLPEITIPPGDPAALREAARTYEAAAEQARQVGLRVRGTGHGLVGYQWSGVASSAFVTEVDRVAASHERALRELHAGSGALYRYAHWLEGAQDLSFQARAAREEYNRQVVNLRARQEAAGADPAARAQAEAQAGQLAAERSRVLALDSQAHTQARYASQTAAAAFSAVAQGALGIAFPDVARAAFPPKIAADGVLGMRKQMALSRGWQGGQLVGSTDEALVRWLGTRWDGVGRATSRFAPALRVTGKFAPAVGGGFGVYQLVNPNSTTEQRLTGLATAAGGGVLTAAAFGAFSGMAVVPVIGAGVLAGVGLYQLGKLTYQHWDDIKWGVSQAGKAVYSGVMTSMEWQAHKIDQAGQWAADRTGDARQWAADRIDEAAVALAVRANEVSDAASGAMRTVTKRADTVADAFGV